MAIIYFTYSSQARLNPWLHIQATNIYDNEESWYTIPASDDASMIHRSSLWWSFCRHWHLKHQCCSALLLSDLFVRPMVHYHNLLCTSLFERRSTLPSWVALFSIASLSAINFANLEPFVSPSLSPRGSIGRWSIEGLCLEDKGGVNAHTEESCSSGLSRYSNGDRSCMSVRKNRTEISDVGIVPTKCYSELISWELQNLLRACRSNVTAFILHTGKDHPLSENGSIRNSRIKYLQQTWRWALKLHMECWSSNVEWPSLHHV